MARVDCSRMISAFGHVVARIVHEELCCIILQFMIQRELQQFGVSFTRQILIVVIKAGEVIARIHMYKIATLGSGNPRNFTWNIISNNSVVMPTGGCTVDSRNVTVNLPDFPGSAEIPLGVYCSSEQKLSFYLSGATTDSARQVFANTAPDATKASGVGVSLMRNGKTLATGENVSLGTVNKSKVPLGLSATYGQTGNKVAAGAVQSVIGVTFIYE